MTSVGDTLRRERLKRKLGLDQISRELKISGRLLEAIESDQYERLPGGVFVKAFVRQYAAILGLDGEDLASQVQRAIEPAVPQFSEPSKHSGAPIDIPPVEPWTYSGRRGFHFPGSLAAAILVVVVMLICSAVYAWMQRPRTTATAHKPTTPPPSVRIEHAPLAAPSQTASAPSPVPAEAQQAKPGETPQAGVVSPSQTPPAPGSSPATAAPVPATAASGTTPPAPAGPVHVEIQAAEPVWMLAHVDGKFAFTGTLEPNSTKTLDAEKDVQLRLGNAGGVNITLNGKPVGPVGPKGQVRTLQLTSGGFQIVSAKPAPSASFDPLDRF